MPNIPIFINESDVDLVLKWLNEDPDIAVLINCGQGEGNKRKWRAELSPQSLECGYYHLWHIPSGPVVYEGEKRNDPDWIEINDPFNGYEAYPYNNNWDLQNVGNKPQFFELEIKTKEEGNPQLIGLSNFSWIGSRFEQAPESAKKWWSKLRTFLRKNSNKIQGNGINSSESTSFFCMPAAYAKLNKSNK